MSDSSQKLIFHDNYDLYPGGVTQLFEIIAPLFSRASYANIILWKFMRLYVHVRIHYRIYVRVDSSKLHLSCGSF